MMWIFLKPDLLLFQQGHSYMANSVESCNIQEHIYHTDPPQTLQQNFSYKPIFSPKWKVIIRNNLQDSDIFLWPYHTVQLLIPWHDIGKVYTLLQDHNSKHFCDIFRRLDLGLNEGIHNAQCPDRIHVQVSHMDNMLNLWTTRVQRNLMPFTMVKIFHTCAASRRKSPITLQTAGAINTSNSFISTTWLNLFQN